ncbi:SseB family protein [Catellatospora vulcania]|uniref:SseB family protein n=1 Tax=Catellatospora vulcania TaxID=1460450 RepID=UPI0012D437FD|nr:SseB family protein [Catellatospora vulcania]
MTDTPLSDALVAHAEDPNPETFDRFATIFRASMVGVMSDKMMAARGAAVVSGGRLTIASTSFNDGRSRILTFADPEVFLRTYGPRFDAGLRGEDVLRMAAGAPDCHGILVNCATREIAQVISKEMAQALIAPPAAAPPPRPWWKRR